MARPSATRCRSPPDSPDVFFDNRCSMRSRRAVSAHARADLAARHALAFQGKPVVVGDIHVRVKRKELEHESNVARRGAAEGDILAVEQDTPVGRQLEPGDHAQCRGLAAAEGPSIAKNVPSSMVKFEPCTAVN